MRTVYEVNPMALAIRHLDKDGKALCGTVRRPPRLDVTLTDSAQRVNCKFCLARLEQLLPESA